MAKIIKNGTFQAEQFVKSILSAVENMGPETRKKLAQACILANQKDGLGTDDFPPAVLLDAAMGAKYHWEMAKKHRENNGVNLTAFERFHENMHDLCVDLLSRNNALHLLKELGA